MAIGDRAALLRTLSVEPSPLHVGLGAQVHRARGPADQAYILKLLAARQPSAAERQAFRQEYVLASAIDDPRCVRPLAWGRWGGHACILFPDVGPSSAADCLRRTGRVPLARGLAWGLDAARALMAVHAARLAHCDVAPHNLVVSADQARCALVDFGLAIPVPEAESTQPLGARQVIRGSLRYLSPEQTRRTTHPVDHRSDLYSLGATLYELLSGRPPFTQTDPLELIHAHLTSLPPDLGHLCPDLPPAVGQIVARLLAKDPARRYQTAAAVASDLERCLGADPAALVDFVPGQAASPIEVRLPTRLHGRAPESRALLDHLQAGAPHSLGVLVGGFSGVGKSALLRSVLPKLEARGYLIGAGKYDQFQEDIAFFGLQAALSQLLEPLLADGEGDWPQRIRRSLGPDLEALTALAPPLGRLASGPPGPRRPVGPEARNQLMAALTRLLALIVESGRLVCLFLDDLQWADPASLGLIEGLLGRRALGGLLVLGAYRDHELVAGHPAARALARCQASPGVLHMPLAPLDTQATEALISDMLQTSPERIGALADAVFARAEGNPLMIGHFVRSLVETGVLSEARGAWRWSTHGLSAALGNADILALMVRKIERLEPAAVAVIQAAAAVGPEADLDLLGRLTGRGPSRLLRLIRPAVEQGLLAVVGPLSRWPRRPRRLLARRGRRPLHLRCRPAPEPLRLRFLHDRIQQAAYAMIPEAQRPALHARIGRRMLGAAPAGARLASPRAVAGAPPRIPSQPARFAALDQCLRGEAALDGADCWLIPIARDALRAAARATAHPQAARYGGLAARLWDAQRQTPWGEARVELELHLAVSHSLAAEFDAADAAFPRALAATRCPDQRARIHMALSDHHLLLGRFKEGIVAQLEGLRALGIQLEEQAAGADPRRCSKLAAALTRTDAAVGASIEALRDRPLNLGVAHEARLHLLYGLFLASYLTGQPVLPFLAIARMTEVSATDGTGPLSPYGYVAYGMTLTLIRDAFAEGRRFGEVGVTLADRLADPAVASKTHFLFAADVHNWTGPILDSLRHYETARQHALAVGDWLTVGYVIMQSSSDRLTAGEPLEQLLADAAHDVAFLTRTGNTDALATLEAGALGPIRQLRGEATGADPISFDGEAFSEAAYLARYADNEFYLAWLYYAKLRAVYLFCPIEIYAPWAERVAVVERSVPSHSKVPEASLYAALMRCALAEQGGAQRATHLAELDRLRARLAVWEQAGPANLRHKRAIVEGETHRVHGRWAEALATFEAAAAAAADAHCLSARALAAERASELLAARGQATGARLWRQDAYHAWLDWGAPACAARLAPLLDLQRAEGVLLSSAPREAASPLSGAHTGLWVDALDVASIIRSLRALHQATDEEQLATQLIEILSREVGATSAYLAFQGGAGAPQLELIAEYGVAGARPSPRGPLAAPAGPAPLVQDLMVRSAAQGRILRGRASEAAEAAGSVLCVPLEARGRSLGVIALVNDLVDGAFSGRHEELVKLLAAQAALTLAGARALAEQQVARAQLETTVEDRTRHLQAALDELREARAALVSARDTAEAHRRRAEAANVAKSDFLSTVSHELRTPLNSMLGFIQILERRPLEPELRDGIQILGRSGRHLLNLVEELLDLARIEAGHIKLQPGPVDVGALVRRALESLRPEAEARGLRLECRVDPRLARPRQLDPQRLTQILLNLLGNALKFTERGQVTLEASLVGAGEGAQGERPDTPAPPAPAAFLSLAITDTGPGLNPDEIARIFERFGRLQSSARGSGLGLPIARHLCRLQGGDLTVESRPGHGSRFTATLRAPPSEASLPPPADAPHPASQGLLGYSGPAVKLIIVEDDPDSLDMLGQLLRPLGFLVRLIPDAEEALRVHAEQPAALVLTDLNLEGASGVDLAARLRAVGFTGPIGLVSADLIALRAVDLTPLDPCFTVEKPLDLGALLEALGRALGLEWIERTPPPQDPPAPPRPSPSERARIARLIEAGRTGELLAVIRDRRANHGANDRFARDLEAAVLTFSRARMRATLEAW